MARVRIDTTSLVIAVEGLDKLWALKSILTIPLAHVQNAVADPHAGGSSLGLRLGGTSVPGVITAGTFLTHGELVFWDVHDRRKALVIDLHDEKYARLVIQVGNPPVTAGMIRAAIGLEPVLPAAAYWAAPPPH